jgi:hypothetical protein
MINSLFAMITLSSSGIFYLYKKLSDELKEISDEFNLEIKRIGSFMSDIDKKLAVKSTCVDYLSDEFEELKSVVMKHNHAPNRKRINESTIQ